MESSSSPFLSLPYHIRKRIYLFANIVRECPIEFILPTQRATHASDIAYIVSTIPPPPPRPPGYIEPPHSFMLGCPVQNAIYECECPEISIQLLFVNKTIHSEVLPLIYGMNKFIIGSLQASDYQVLDSLSSEAIQNLRHVHVQLNECFCCPCHHLDQCYRCGTTFQPSDRELLTGETGSEDRIREWAAICSRLSAQIPGSLNLELFCNVKDLATARRLLEPINDLPRLNSLAISFGRHHDSTLRSLAYEAVRRATGERNGLEPATSTFPLLRLPHEIQLKILGFTHLAPDFDSGSRAIIVKSGKRLGAQKCCRRCSFTHHDCCCSEYHTSCAPNCRCKVLPLEVFRVSRQLYVDACEVFYRTNMFTFCGSFQKTLEMLQACRPDVLKQFRRVGFGITVGGVELLREGTEDDWLSLISFVGKHFDLSKLLIIIDTQSRGVDSIQQRESRESLIRRKYNGDIAVAKVMKRAPLRGLQDLHFYLRSFCDLEPVLERHIMGPEYNSSKGNQHSKPLGRFAVLDPVSGERKYPQLPRSVVEIPSWHRDL